MNEFSIVASTKVAALLDRYPELEDLLIGLAPAFVKLKNPLLRKSVAKVATLRQAAAVGGMPVTELVNKLRAAVGQAAALDVDEDGGRESYFSPRPDWFDLSNITASIDDRGEDQEDSMPLVHVYEKARLLKDAEILELVTAHLPAPGIDIMKKRGFLVFCVQDGPNVVRTYFRNS